MENKETKKPTEPEDDALDTVSDGAAETIQCGICGKIILKNVLDLYERCPHCGQEPTVISQPDFNI